MSNGPRCPREYEKPRIPALAAKHLLNDPLVELLEKIGRAIAGALEQRCLIDRPNLNISCTTEDVHTHAFCVPGHLEINRVCTRCKDFES
jgi:hypothetical protein